MTRPPLYTGPGSMADLARRIRQEREAARQLGAALVAEYARRAAARRAAQERRAAELAGFRKRRDL
jgi:hypothetical protein